MLVLIVNTFLPFFSLGEDIKMMKDCGLVTLLFSGLILAVWSASLSVAEEIEGKTAMTLLSKPINRRQFVVGKYIGILQAVLLLLIPLVIAFFVLLYYKVGYDARESAKEVPEWGFQQMRLNPLRLEAVKQVIPGIVLIVFEIAVLAAVSVAISIRLPDGSQHRHLPGNIRDRPLDSSAREGRGTRFRASQICRSIDRHNSAFLRDIQYGSSGGDRDNGASGLSDVFHVLLCGLLHSGDSVGLHIIRGPRFGLSVRAVLTRDHRGNACVRLSRHEVRARSQPLLRVQMAARIRQTWAPGFMSLSAGLLC